MERKTERINGLAVSKERYIKHSACHDCEHQSTKNCLQDGCTYGSILNALAEYEDIGLTPEEIKDILSVLSENQDDVDEDGISTGLIHDLLELARYRQAEEQGLLITLPCKVGDTICYISKRHNEITEYTVMAMIIEPDTVMIDVRADSLINVKQFGKTVFLTREEAEEALKGGEVE